MYHNKIKNSKTQLLKEKIMIIESQLKIGYEKTRYIILFFIFIKYEYKGS